MGGLVPKTTGVITTSDKVSLHPDVPLLPVGMGGRDKLEGQTVTNDN